MSAHTSISDDGNDDPGSSSVRNYMRDFEEVDKDTQEFTLRLADAQYQDLDIESARAWTHALQSFPEAERRRKVAEEASDVLKERIEKAKESIAALTNVDGVRERLEEIEPLDSRELHNRSIDMVKRFLQKTPNIIPDLQSAGIDVGAETRETVTAVTEAIEKLTTENDDLRHQFSECESQSSTIQSQIEEWNVHIDTIRSKLDKIGGQRKKLIDLQKRLDISKERSNAQRRELNDAHAIIDAHEASIEEQGSNLRDSKLRADAAELECIGLRTTSTNRLTALRAARRELDDLHRMLDVSHRDNETIIARLRTDLAAADQQATADYHRFEAERTFRRNVEARAADVEKELELQSELLNQTRDSRDDTVVQLNGLQTEYQRQSDALREARARQASAETDLALVQRRLADNESKITDLELQVRQQIDELRSRQEMISQHAAENMTLRLEMDEHEAEYESTLTDTEAQLKESENINELLRGSLDRRRNALTELENASKVNEEAWRTERSHLEAVHQATLTELQASSARETTTTQQLTVVTQEADMWKLKYEQLTQQLSAEKQRADKEIGRLQASNATNVDALDEQRSKLQETQSNLANRTSQLVRYRGIAEQFVITSSQQVDVDVLARSWDRFSKTLGVLRLRSNPLAVSNIHGLTTSLAAGETAFALASRLTTVSQSNSARFSVAEIQQLTTAIQAGDEALRPNVLSMLFHFIMKRHSIASERPVNFETSLVLLRSIEVFSTWVDPTCQAYGDIANLTLADMPVDVSSPLVGALLEVLRVRFSGASTTLEAAVRSKTIPYRDRCELDQHTVVRETGGLLIITPHSDVIYARLSGLRLERTVEGGHQQYVNTTNARHRLVATNCPLLGDWKTNWWFLKEHFHFMGVFTDVEKAQNSSGPVPVNLLLQEQ